MKKLLLVIILFTNVFLSNAQSDTAITTFVNVHQGNGLGLATREVIDTFYFPSDVSMYDSIGMTVLLRCPTGGCDPWDRFASVKVYHEGDWYEIGRYITPYGRSCGWTVDVSDYREMLHDTVIIKSFIDTWTNPGWLVNYTFNFHGGVPAHPFVKVENLWNNYNVVYGDSTQPVNIPEQFLQVENNVTGVKLKMVNTGHGQGNLNNAAEFSNKTHQFVINGTQTLNHNLWRSNCGTNPCSPQSGTWQYNRAGWCPGADVLPAEYDITQYVTAGQSVGIKYNLQNYYNTCSPNNPNCVTTGSCPDCNYNYNGHTEPHYKIAAQMISYLSTPLSVTSERSSAFTIYPNPSAGRFTIAFSQTGEKQLTVNSAYGVTLWSGKVKNGDQIDVSFLSKGFYLIGMENGSSRSFKRVVIN